MSENNPKKNVFMELLLGLGIPILAYTTVAGLTWSSGFPTSVNAILTGIEIAVLAIVIVKLFRTGHEVAAILVITMMSPVLFVLVLAGACSFMGGFSM